MRSCYFCQEEIAPDVTIGYATLCPHCGKPLKICFNCRFYDPNAYHQCKESVEEQVLQKDRANFCELFVMSNQSSSDEQLRKKEEARKKFLSLFDH